VLEALLGSTKGVSSDARRFRLRCLKSVILLLDASPDLEFDMGSGKEADETAMMTPQQKRQQVHAVQPTASSAGMMQCRAVRFCHNLALLAVERADKP
jgi:hypothetical protein